jgi:aminomethyltransferase
MEKTPLYERHLALGAKMIDFGGWALPVQYRGIIEEHQAVRNHAGLFDICHMGEIEIEGPGAFELLQSIMTRNLASQEVGQIKLSVMTNSDGGIIDDVTVYRLGMQRYMVVTNAETRLKDLHWIETHRAERRLRDIRIRDISAETGKLDLQGPAAQPILRQLLREDLSALKFYYAIETTLLDEKILLSRSGYTGEDGFEIYADSERIGRIWDALLAAGSGVGLNPAGLGARDTLRIEAGMMLYGHDLSETVTPLEVVYSWVVDLNKDFIGSDALRRQKGRGGARKLVGFEMTERGIARAGYPVLWEDRQVGEVTSGTYSPTLERAIGFAFVPPSCAEKGTEIAVRIRDQSVGARVVPLPFYRGGRQHAAQV